MRLPLICAQCMSDNIESAQILKLAEFLDDNVYEVECPKGHRTITVLQQQKFEILFEIGAYAIVDGYYREAVSSFTSSLERFYEFFVRASLIEAKVAANTIADVWRLVATQSERQLGAFIFLFTLTTGSAPLTLSSKQIEFRNAVIHKGVIPSRQEAELYGNSVLNIIRAGLNTAKQYFPNGVTQAAMQVLMDANKQAAERGTRTSTASLGTIIGLEVADQQHHARTLQEAITQLPNWRHRARA
jgi:hypothetical protein